MCIYTYSVILALRFESFSENTVLHVFTDLKRFDAGERIFKRLELSKQRSPCSTYGYLCLIDRSIFLQLTSTDDCAAPHGTRDTKINDGKSQIKSRKKLTKKKNKKKERCERVFTSYPISNHSIPICLIISFLTVRIIVHGVLFINVSHHHGLLYYSFVLSTNKINTA